MTALGFVLFPDAREGDGPIGAVNAAIRAVNSVGGAQYHAPFRPVRMSGPRVWHSFGAAIEPDEMLRILRSAQWEHPAKLLYRFEDEDHWSFVTLGLSSPEHEFPEWSG